MQKKEWSQHDRKTAPPVWDSTVPLPSAHDMERGVLSCMLQAPEYAVMRAGERVAPEDFNVPAFRILYDLLRDMADKGAPIDPTTVQQELMDRKLMDTVGGPAMVAELYTFAPTPAHVAHYASQVREKASARRVMIAAFAMVDKIQEDPVDWSGHAAELVDAVIREQTTDEGRRTIVPIRAAVIEAVEELGEAVNNRGHVTHGFATGFTALDRMFMGIRRTQTVVIAARPSMGKTALAVNILENMSLGVGDYREFYHDANQWPGCRKPRQGQLTTLLICLESSQIEMASRMVCGRARVSIQRIRDGHMADHDYPRIRDTSKQLSESPMHIWDAAGVDLEELIMRVTAFKAAVPALACVAVDHCGCLKVRSIRDNGDERIRFTYISNRLRDLWKKIDVIGLNLWQLNRTSEKRTDSRPKLADIRSAGAIEEDASKVLMPYRPSYWDDEQPEDEAYIAVPKNRGGPTNTEGVKVRWEGEFTRFSSLESRLFSSNEDERQDAFN